MAARGSGGAAARNGLIACMEASILPRRSDAACDLLSTHGAALRRTARRVSICEADAEDAIGRSLEICLTRVPEDLAPGHLAGWMHVVTRREALAIRRQRERLLSGSGSEVEGEAGCVDALDRLSGSGADPLDVMLRTERVAERAALLDRLKPQERLAITLQAAGYSYAEIRELCGWTFTKVNRCLAEGRARLRELSAPV